TWAEAQPLVLVLENAHWMDEASEALTKILAQQAASTAPLMLLLVHRPELIGGVAPWAELVRLPYFAALVLDEMRDDEMQTFLTHRLGQAATPLLLSVVQTLAQGNPFFAHELVNAMRQSGKIVLDDGMWQVAPDLVRTLQRADFVIQVDGKWQLKPHVDLSTVKLG